MGWLEIPIYNRTGIDSMLNLIGDTSDDQENNKDD
jgi:hypothetical protein